MRILALLCSAAMLSVLGMSVEAQNDVDIDGDGVPEIVGTLDGSVYPDGRKRVIIFSGATAEELIRIKEPFNGGAFAADVLLGPDLNEDGVPDLWVTIPLAKRKQGWGETRVYSGDDGRWIGSLQGAMSDIAGAALRIGGDSDGDGINEVLMSSDFVDESFNVWREWVRIGPGQARIPGIPAWGDDVPATELLLQGADLNADGVVDALDVSLIFN